jgi:hypothetical protein
MVFVQSIARRMKMSEKSTLAGEFVEIDIGLLTDAEWNPNRMKDKEFNRLVKEIEENGMIDPIQVVPIAGGKYRIIGGHHRKMACKLIGYNKVPCVILSDVKWQDEERQKLETVRLNAIKGSMNGEKMLALYQEVASKHGADSVADLMGFTDEDAFRKIVGQAKKAIRDAGLPPEAEAELEDKAKNAKSLDNLSEIIYQIHQKYGSTLNQHFIYFDFGGKKNLHVEVDSTAFKAIEKMMAQVKRSGIDAGDFFGALATNWRAAVEIEEADEDESGEAH